MLAQRVVNHPPAVKHRRGDQCKEYQDHGADIGFVIKRNHEAADILQRKPERERCRRHGDIHRRHTVGMLFKLGGRVDDRGAKKQHRHQELSGNFEIGVIGVHSFPRNAYPTQVCGIPPRRIKLGTRPSVFI